MRRAAITALVLLSACASPTGAERIGCDADWLDVRTVAAQGGGVQEQTLPIECIEQIANRRVRVGFSLPAGQSCHVLSRVELVESANAVSVTLIGAENDDPNAGACPEEARRAVTEIDLASPVDDRGLLDGSAGGSG